MDELHREGCAQRSAFENAYYHFTNRLTISSYLSQPQYQHKNIHFGLLYTEARSRDLSQQMSENEKAGIENAEFLCDSALIGCSSEASRKLPRSKKRVGSPRPIMTSYSTFPPSILGVY